MDRRKLRSLFGSAIVVDETLPQGCIGAVERNRIVVFRVTDCGENVERVTDNVVRVSDWAKEKTRAPTTRRPTDL